MHSSSQPAPIGSWIFVGVVVPAIFIGLDMGMLSLMHERAEDYLLHALLLFVVQVGVFGVLCGRLIEWPLLRWIIYGWCWLLTDVQLSFFATIFRGTLASYHRSSNLLIDSMFAAQFGLLTIWVVLGNAWWGWRL